MRFAEIPRVFGKGNPVWRAVCISLMAATDACRSLITSRFAVVSIPGDFFMNGCRKIVSVVVVLGLCLSTMMPAVATPLNLDTGVSLTLNPALSTTGTLTLAATNENAGSAITSFNSWGLILQLIPQPGAVGSASISALTSPTLNPALTEAGEPLFDDQYTTNIPVNGTVNAYLVGIANDTPVTTTFALGQTYNLGDFAVTLSPDAQGSWALYALNDQSNTGSWASEIGAQTAFGNLAQASAGQYTTLALGTVTAVPEPSGLMLAGSAIVAAGWFGWRSRRQPTVVEA
jgi:hypothetical protein